MFSWCERGISLLCDVIAVLTLLRFYASKLFARKVLDLNTPSLIREINKEIARCSAGIVHFVVLVDFCPTSSFQLSTMELKLVLTSSFLLTN